MDFREPPAPRRPETILPMVNLVFLLLIFFLMVATLAPPAPVPVEPPRAAAAHAPEAGPLRLHLDAAGTARFRGLSGPGALAAAAAEQAPVIVHADRAAPAPALARALAALAPARVSLIVEPAP